MIDIIKRLSNKNKFCYYMIYALFNLYGIVFSALCLLMRIFPIKANKIVCCNMKGKRYGDNPKYIADEIVRQKLNYDIVWLMKDKENADLPEGVRPVKYNPIMLAYELSTAKIWIDSNTKPLGVKKRKGQYYIQTWHGSYGLKKMYGDIPDKMNLFDKRNIQYNSNIQDLFVSNSDFYSDIYRRAFWYNGEILQCGSPRNDIFFTENEECLKRVQEYFHTEGKKMALYAPTYRNNFGTDAYRLDFERMRQNLEKRFGGEWVILVRLHPHNMMDAKAFLEYNDYIINATEYSVMQELLVACDILVSDYSSCMFDFVTTKKPCFMYASDAAQYKDEHDFYFDIYKLPFPLAENNEEMEERILQFDKTVYQEELQKMFDEVGLSEDGTACKQVVEWIKNHQKVLFVTTKNLDYLRNTQEIRLIKESGREVRVIGSSKKSYAARLLKVYWQLLWCRRSRFDKVFVGFAPQLVVPFFGWKFRGRELTIDFFISMYDTLVFDRKKFKEGSFPAKILKWFDTVTIRKADKVISDTKAHGNYFVEEFGLAEDKLNVLYLEADTTIYYPREQKKPERMQGKYTVLYFGSILPLQGLEVILKAVDMLKDNSKLHFVIVGPIQDKFEKPESANVEYHDWLSQEELAEYIGYSDLCLAGHFNKDINKAKRTIPGKAYIYSAMKKPMILGDNSATHELYNEEMPGICFVEMGNAKALSDKIEELAKKEGF